MKKCCRCKKAAVIRQRLSVPGDSGRWKDYCEDHRIGYDAVFAATPADAPVGWEASLKQERYAVA